MQLPHGSPDQGICRRSIRKPLVPSWTVPRPCVASAALRCPGLRRVLPRLRGGLLLRVRRPGRACRGPRVTACAPRGRRTRWWPSRSPAPGRTPILDHSRRRREAVPHGRRCWTHQASCHQQRPARRSNSATGASSPITKAWSRPTQGVSRVPRPRRRLRRRPPRRHGATNPRFGVWCWGVVAGVLSVVRRRIGQEGPAVAFLISLFSHGWLTEPRSGPPEARAFTWTVDLRVSCREVTCSKERGFLHGAP